MIFENEQIDLFNEEINFPGFEDKNVDGISFDICYNEDEITSIPHVNLMTGDEGEYEGEELGHRILNTIEFKDISNLKLFHTGLKLILQATVNNDEKQSMSTSFIKKLENIILEIENEIVY